MPWTLPKQVVVQLAAVVPVTVGLPAKELLAEMLYPPLFGLALPPVVFMFQP